MTQPIRLKITATSNKGEKPPSFDMKLLVKRMFYRCIPCLNLRNRDEKLPLTPRSLTSNDYDE